MSYIRTVYLLSLIFFLPFCVAHADDIDELCAAAESNGHGLIRKIHEMGQHHRLDVDRDIRALKETTANYADNIYEDVQQGLREHLNLFTKMHAASKGENPGFHLMQKAFEDALSINKGPFYDIIKNRSKAPKGYRFGDRGIHRWDDDKSIYGARGNALTVLLLQAIHHIEGVDVANCSVFDEGWVDESPLVHKVLLSDALVEIEGVRSAPFFYDDGNPYMIMCGHGRNLGSLMQALLDTKTPILPAQHYYAQWDKFHNPLLVGKKGDKKLTSQHYVKRAIALDPYIKDFEENMTLQGVGFFDSDVCGVIRTDVYFKGIKEDMCVGQAPTDGEMGIVLGAVTRERGLQHVVVFPSAHCGLFELALRPAETKDPISEERLALFATLKHLIT